MAPSLPSSVTDAALAALDKAQTLEELHRIVSGVPAQPNTENVILYCASVAPEVLRCAQEATGYSLIDDTARAALLQHDRFLAKLGQLAGMDASDIEACAKKIRKWPIDPDDPEAAAIQLAKDLLFGKTGDPASLKESFWGRASDEFVRGAGGEVLLLVGENEAAEQRVFWAVELPALQEGPGERRINGREVGSLPADPDAAFAQLKPGGRGCSTGFGEMLRVQTPGGKVGTPGRSSGGGGGGGGLPAARIGDFHACPMVTVLVPHVGGPIALGEFTVLVGGMPAARVGDMAVCVGPPDAIALGSFTVLIGGKPAARLGDMTAHGGVIAGGMPTVTIG